MSISANLKLSTPYLIRLGNYVVGSMTSHLALCGHYHLQDVVTGVALPKELVDKLEEAVQRVTSDRLDPLSHSIFSLCEGNPFRFHPRGRSPLE